MIRKWIEEKHLHVAALTETWMTPEEQPPRGVSEYVTLQSKRGRSHGGVALCVHPLLQYRLMTKMAQKEYQYILIQIGGMIVGTVYISPRAPLRSIQQCMKELRQNCRGPAVIMGDLNARNIEWDRTANTIGRYVSTWARDNRWTIHAPNNPTFYPSAGVVGNPSVIDLMLSQQMPPMKITTDEGDWTGMSDHIPISTSTTNNTLLRRQPADRPIPHAMRIDTTRLEKASSLYKKEIPHITQQVQTCEKAEELDRLLELLNVTVLEPWRRRPGRMQGIHTEKWSRALQKKVGRRSKSYKAARKLNTTETWQRYRTLDREVKREVRALHQKRKRANIEALTRCNAQTASAKLSHMVRMRKQRAQDSVQCGPPLDKNNFAKHLATEQGEGFTPSLQPFKIDGQFEKDMVKAIQNAPNGKSVGTDGVFAESLKVEPEIIAKVLCTIWAKCGELRHIPLTWRVAIIIPIYKKGAVDDPSNYRPISIISQMRKIVDKTIDITLRRNYTFHPAQLGFRKGVSSGTAVMRCTYLAEEGYEHTAILDLKKAYDTVPRDRLMKIVERVLPNNLARMIAYILQPMAISMTRNKPASREHLTIRIGVPQGDPTSTTLFNLFFDALAARVLDTTETFYNAKVGIVMFADDVKLKAKTQRDLQGTLDESTKWAAENDMTWSTKKCYTLETNQAEAYSYQISGEQIQPTPSMQYLGITMDGKRVQDASTIKRCKIAMGKLRDLEKIGMKDLPPARRLIVCKTLILPIAEYAIDITPQTKNSEEQYDRLHHAIVQSVLGKVPYAGVARARKLCKLLPQSYRAATLFDRLELKVEKRVKGTKQGTTERTLAEHDRNALILHRKAHDLPNRCPKEQIEAHWKGLCAGEARKIPNPKEKCTTPTLSLMNKALRQKATSWFFNKFPTQNRKTRTEEHRQRRQQDSYQTSMTTLRELMEKTEWSTEEQTVVEKAIDTIAEVDEEVLNEQPNGRRAESSQTH